MEIIKVNNLKKHFKVRKRKENDNFFSTLVSRQYESTKAVDDISFSINKGEIVGYLGPNGAGKSTTIKMLSGILAPTSGEIVANGYNPHKERKQYVKNIGVVFGQRTQLWWDIPVYESLNLMKYMYRIPDTQFKNNIDMFNDILGIHEFSATPVRQLSLGQRMRADLCVSLLHNPDIVFLDEPTIGLDAIVKKRVREFVQQVNNEKKTTFLLTTHDMADIEKLCSRVIIIDHGKIIYNGDLSTVKESYGYMEQMLVKLETDPDDLSALYNLGIQTITKNENVLELYYNKHEVTSTQVLKYLMDYSTITDFRVVETEIEEAIRNIYISTKTMASKGD